MFFRVLNNANGKKGPSHSATGMTGAKFAERGHRFADGTLHHSRTNNLAHADLTVSDTLVRRLPEKRLLPNRR